jgi:hypothetical protein
MIIESPVFILGMPRSGTTVVRSILNQHPSIAIAPETHFLTAYVDRNNKPEVCLQKYIATDRFKYLDIDDEKLISRLKQEVNLTHHAIFDAILKEYAHFMGKSIFGEKTPGNYEHVDTLLHWYPNARIIWMIRDPRAVAASYQNVGWHSKDVIGPAIRWRKSMKLLDRWEKSKNVVIVKYEDLVKEPQKTIDSVLEFCGIKSISTIQIFEHRKEPQISCRKGWASEHFKAAAGPININSLYKWRNILTSKQIVSVECITYSGMRKMNYEKINNISIIDNVSTYIKIARLLTYKPDLLLKKIMIFLCRKNLITNIKIV